jgi:RNA polymerase primary sigma factor
MAVDRKPQLDLEGRPEVAAEEIDPLLDVPPARFSQAADALARILDERGISILFPPVPARSALPESADDPTHPSLIRLYRDEVARIEPMDRAEEIRLAKRVEFTRRRYSRLLAKLGFPVEEDSRLFTGSCDHEGRAGKSVCLFEPAPPERRSALHARRAEVDLARSGMVERTLHLVLRLVERFRGLGVATMDLVQESNASLFRAVEGFDWTRGVRFTTYATFWINQACLNLLYNTGRTVRVPAYIQKAMKKINEARMREANAAPESIAKTSGLPLDLVRNALSGNRYSLSLDRQLAAEDPGDGRRLLDVLEDPRAGIDLDALEEGQLAERLREALASLPPRERLIVELRYGLNGSRPHTLAEVGRVLHVSLERVRQVQEVALARMRASRGREFLEQFVS